MRSPGEHTRAYLAIGVAMVSISFASIFIKWSESAPFVIASYRLGITCLILLPFLNMDANEMDTMATPIAAYAFVCSPGERIAPPRPQARAQ